jgi:hypothetical protein
MKKLGIGHWALGFFNLGLQGQGSRGKGLMVSAPCPMPHAPCPMPHALCPMPYAPCPIPDYPLFFIDVTHSPIL